MPSVLLFTLGQLAICAAAASLLDRVPELSFGSVSGHSLLIAAEGDRVITNAVTGSEGLIEIMDHGRNSLREPMMQLSASAEALAAMAKAISERPTDAAPAAAYAAIGEQLETAIDRLTAKIEQLAERPIDGAPAAAYAAIGEEFKTAIDRLAAKIEQIADTPIAAAPAVAKSQRSEVPGGLEELRDLLKEFE